MFQWLVGLRQWSDSSEYRGTVPPPEQIAGAQKLSKKILKQIEEGQEKAKSAFVLSFIILGLLTLDADGNGSDDG
ncbi:MAG: hypothetical protein QGI93_03930, partial [Planctomycetota bacterium]|nr:hypothetical protein [Planctomycetota bacterium]